MPVNRSSALGNTSNFGALVAVLVASKTMSKFKELISRTDFERDDFNDRCIFTGVPVKKKGGEHVIPRWLINDYQLADQRVEMGHKDSLAAAAKEFRSPAESVANNKFGELENRVKLGQASQDELHLWQKKMSVGMVLNHWRMARNDRHPHAPVQMDTRYLAIALADFRKDFQAFVGNNYTRTGSTVTLPTSISGGWIAHAFGAMVKDLSQEHDAFLPFGFLVVSHDAKLIVSALHDPEHEFEASRLVHEWQEKQLHKQSETLPIQAALAVCFAEFMAQSSADIFGEKQELKELLELVGYQLGVEINSYDQTYRRR